MQKLLYPFAYLYDKITAFRNYRFDKGYAKSVEFDLSLIGVGNLRVGGTGKTPHIEYLIRLLQKEQELAVLSRGYRRRTKGFVLADETTTAFEIGDEPQQIKNKFPNVVVAVGEERALAIPFILAEYPDIDLILLDDAFQHRQVKLDCSILLTTYQEPFFKDYVLPYGRLREHPSNYKRADIIIVTKCPMNLSEAEKKEWMSAIQPFAHQQVFFSHLNYKEPYSIHNFANKLTFPSEARGLLLCGIALTEELESYLGTQLVGLERQMYGDHHYFTQRELDKVEKWVNDDTNRIVLTTEKDAQRLLLHQEWLEKSQLPIFVLPVAVSLAEQGEKQLIEAIKSKLKDK